MNAMLRDNAYGHFSGDGLEYVITDPRTPRPWVNVIANPRLGLVVSHTGSGFTFIDNSQLGVITRWQQELVEDCSGKALYLRDAATGSVETYQPGGKLVIGRYLYCQRGPGVRSRHAHPGFDVGGCYCKRWQTGAAHLDP